MLIPYEIKTPDMALKKLKEIFNFPLFKQQQMMNDFQEQMDRGLEGRESLFGMYKTFVPLPTGKEEGLVLVIDLGGSNLRVMMIKLHNGKGDVLDFRKTLLTPKEMETSADLLFSRVAEKVLEVLQNYSTGKIPLGFTFSYPMKMTARNGGIITRLTKQLTATGLVGNDPVHLLMDEINKCDPKEGKKLFPGAIINDTVAELVYGAFLHPEDKGSFFCRIGGIIGTGANFACLINGEIINLECGNFYSSALPITPYDADLDSRSPNPGNQRMEKLIAGAYLGQIGGLVLQDFIESKNLIQKQIIDVRLKVRAEDLSALESAENPGQIKSLLDLWGLEKNSFPILKEVAEIISTRGTKVSAGAIGAIAQYIDPEMKKAHFIPMDGSVIGKYFLYKERISGVLHQLIPSGDFKLLYIPDGSGMGAAVAGIAEG